MAINVRSPKDIDALRIPNKLVGETLQYLTQNIKSGMTLLEVDKLGEEFIVKNGGRPAFKGLYGFPSAVCTSLNEVVIHGVPNNTILKDGDILGIDLGVEIDGWYGDAAKTLPIGEISKENQDLIACAKDAVYFAANIIKPGMRFKELSFELEKFITSKGYIPLVGFCGHGIGRSPHEEPQIPNYLEHGTPKSGPKIKNGMVFCIEPMVCQKESKSVVDENDKWSVTSTDNLKTSHWEHTFAVVNNKVEILTEL
jgi:methionyl aminopeptidase